MNATDLRDKIRTRPFTRIDALFRFLFGVLTGSQVEGQVAGHVHGMVHSQVDAHIYVHVDDEFREPGRGIAHLTIPQHAATLELDSDLYRLAREQLQQ